METLHYKDYEGSVEVSIEGRCLHGKLLFVDDLVTYEGKDFEELEVTFRESVNDYLAFCAEIGKAPEKPYKGIFNVRVRPEIHRELVVLAYHSQQTLNELVCKALETYVSERAVHHTHHHIHEHVLMGQPKRVSWSSNVSETFFEAAVSVIPDSCDTAELAIQPEGTEHWNRLTPGSYGRC